MLRFWLALFFLTTSVSAQSPIDLLNRVAHHYANVDSFEVKGTALAPLPGSSWESGYTFEYQGIQPKLLPPDLHAPSMRELGSVGGAPIRIRIDAHASDPFPTKSFTPMRGFGDYQRLTYRLLDAREVGKEIITIDNHSHTCEIIDARFDDSPDFAPNTATADRRFWIDPTELVVLREQRSFDGLRWTANITSFSFNQPISPETVKTLQSVADQPKERPYWIGRPLPDITLQQLSGPPIRLADFRGKPLLLDFWGSYCLPCKAATLHVQELAKRYQSSGLAVITLTLDDAATAKLWAAHNHVTLPVILDQTEAAFKAFDAFEVPITIFAGADGKIVHYWTGYEEASAMDAFLRATLQTNTATPNSSLKAH